MKSRLIYTIIVCICAILPSLGQITYVKETASGSGDGGSWSNANGAGDLIGTLNAATAGDVIWVAKGIYKPTGSNRSNSFIIKDGVKLFGGFAGDEPSNYDLSLRDLFLNETILSGDIGVVSVPTDNLYSVIKTTDVSTLTELNGFTIEDGYADDNTSANFEEENAGGAWYNTATTSQTSIPTIKNCIFRSNYAATSGGAIYSHSSVGIAGLFLESCIFQANQSDVGGGAVQASTIQQNDQLSFINCAFAGNRVNGSGSRGGALNIINSSGNNNVNLTNCTFLSNRARFGGGVQLREFGGELNVNLTNSVFWANDAFARNAPDTRNGIEVDGATFSLSHCLLQDSLTTSNGNLNGNVDPKFLNTTNAVDSPNLETDFRLLACSPLINAGTSTGVSLIDVFGKMRTGLPDIGAFEHISNPNSIIYVNDDAGNSGSGSSWEDAISTLQDALTVQNTCGGYDIWVAAGTYYPTEGSDRNVSINITENTRLFGGFVGMEPSTYDLSMRDFTTNPSILSGDINTKNDSTDNSFHVVRMQNVSRSTVLDGFTVKHGQATGAAFSDQLDGAGIFNDGGNGSFASPTIRNCIIRDNYARNGAGILNNGFQGESSPLIEFCTFINNRVTQNGAGVSNDGTQGGISNALIRNSRFLGNYAESRGAGIRNECGGGSCNFEVSGSLFSGNVSELGGTSISNTGGMTMSVTNCTFSGNYSQNDAAGIETSNNTVDGAVKVSNSIFWKNRGYLTNGIGVHVQNFGALDSISYSLFEGVSSSANNNIPSVDPLFEQEILPTTTPSILGDFRLKPCSPVADKGSNDSLEVTYTIDIAKNERVVNTTNLPTAIVDLGAYEFQGSDFPQSLNIEMNQPSDADVIALEDITAESIIIAPAKALYLAGESILLSEGFETQSGTVFTAKIGQFTCPE